MTALLYDIISQHTTLTRKTRTQGGEYCGPCPFPDCGGTNRFCVWPESTTRHGRTVEPHYWCRQCGRQGDTISFLREKVGLSFYDAKDIADGAKNLSDASPTSQRPSRTAPKTTPADIDGAPVQEWQWAGKAFCRVCKAALWSEAGEKALEYLRKRGFADEIIDQHDFGYNSRDWYGDPADWGLAPGEKVWLPRGIIIPYLGEGQLWKIEVRLPVEGKGKRRYHTLAGSSNVLYNYKKLLQAGKKAVLVEGVFNQATLEMALREDGLEEDIITVATSSTGGAHGSRWLSLLSICTQVLVGFDADPNQAGAKATIWWLERLPNARHWSPGFGDINELRRMGDFDLTAWALRGFDSFPASAPVENVLASHDISQISPDDSSFYREEIGECLCFSCLDLDKETPAPYELEELMYCEEHHPPRWSLIAFADTVIDQCPVLEITEIFHVSKEAEVKRRVLTECRERERMKEKRLQDEIKAKIHLANEARQRYAATKQQTFVK